MRGANILSLRDRLCGWPDLEASKLLYIAGKGGSHRCRWLQAYQGS